VGAEIICDRVQALNSRNASKPVGLTFKLCPPGASRRRPDEKLAERLPIDQERAEFDNLRAVVKATSILPQLMELSQSADMFEHGSIASVF
jgi:hypothetical protein